MNLSNADLFAYSQEHLFYEIEMLLSSGQVSFENVPPEAEQTFINMRIESFVIHLRNLITFLYPTGSVRDTDVYASHFFSDVKKWEGERPPLSPMLNAARERAHKEIGHLTTERIAGTSNPKKEWPISDLLREVTLIIKLFCQLADKDKLHSKVSTLL